MKYAVIKTMHTCFIS